MAALSVDGTPMPALPNSADQINYDNTTSGLSATTVKGAVDELASEKQDKSDNSLQTTNKTIVGGINELKSGLTNDYIEYKTDVEAPTRVNLFDKDNLDVVRKYYDGTEWKNQSQGQWETVFIPVVGGATYTLSGFPSQNGVQSVFTTSDKTTVLSKFGAGNNNETHTAPDNAAYIGLGVYEPNASFTSAQMELGTTATAYTPYIPSVESRIEAVEERKTKWFAIEVPANATEYDYSSDAPADAEIISVLPTGGAGLTVVQCHLGQKKIYFASAPTSKAYARVYYY